MQKDEIEIDLRAVFEQVWDHIIIVALATVIGALAMFCVSKAVLPKEFQSNTSIYVLNQQDNQTVTYTDLQTGTQLTKDYAELTTSRTVTARVIAELELQTKYEDMRNITPEALERMISVTTQSDTRILQITVTDSNPNRAQDIANAVRNAAAENIARVMDIEAVNVVDYANLPEQSVSPNTFKNILIGAAVGFVLSVGIIVMIFLLDDTIKTPDDVEKYLGLSVLASIPYDEGMDAKKIKKLKKKKKTPDKKTSENTKVVKE